MPFLLQYLLKLSLTMALLYLFYYVLLRNLTFYKWNRFYLLCYSLLSFFIPFINITPWMPDPATVQPGFIEQVSMLRVLPDHTAPNPLALLSSWTFLIALFVTGVVVMLVRLLMQFLSIQNMKRRATLIQSKHVRLYDVDSAISPFSFAHSVFINSRLHSEDDLKKIIQHEFVHVKQQHTIDLLTGELLCIVNWYNPFAWLIRKAIRQNLEFIADDTVLQSGVDAGQYQYLLLKVTGLPQYSVSSNFNISSLKKRIFMINKLRSASVHLVKFLFVLPLLAVMLLAFRSRQEVKKQEAMWMQKSSATVLDTVLPPPPPPPPPPVKGSRYITKEGLRSEIGHNKATVTLKNGRQEVYNLGNPAEKAAYEKKYGAIPPPPPPPAVPPRLKVSDTLYVNAKITKLVDTIMPVVSTRGIAPVVSDTMLVKVRVTKQVDTVIPVVYVINNLKVTETNLNKFYNQKGDSLNVYSKIDANVESKIAVNEVIGIATNNDTKNVIQEYILDGKVIKPVPGLFGGNLTGFIIVDGKEMSSPDVNKIEPSLIESISILKGNSAVGVYGEKAKDGAIIITTKQKALNRKLSNF